MREAGSGEEVEASSWKCLTWESSSDFLEEPPVGAVGAPWGCMGRGRVLWVCSQPQSCERCPGYCPCCPHTEVSPPGSPLNFGQVWEATVTCSTGSPPVLVHGLRRRCPELCLPLHFRACSQRWFTKNSWPDSFGEMVAFYSVLMPEIGIWIRTCWLLIEICKILGSFLA